MSRVDTIDRYFASSYGHYGRYRPKIGDALLKEVALMGSNGLFPSTACALVEKESGGRNIFGADRGGLFPHARVRKRRVKKLLEHIENGGSSNGVGYTQLTYPPFIRRAEAAGGAHRPRVNMRVGFDILNEMISKYGWQQGAAAYNAGEANRMSVFHTYGADMVRLERAWAERLGASVPGSTPGDPVGPPDWPKEAPPREPIKQVIPSGTWIQRHPTRYNWRPDVKELVYRLFRRFPGISINTYVDHPQGFHRDADSFDVWHRNGRGVPIAPDTGQAIVNYIFNDPNPPFIEWVIWRGWWWVRAYGYWRRFPDDGTGLHFDHPHFTFVRP